MRRTEIFLGVLGLAGLGLAALMLKKHVKAEELRNAAFRVGIAEIHLMPRYLYIEEKPKTSSSYPVAGNA